METISSFGEWLRRARKACDLTQAELAQRVGCAEGTIRNLEADALRPSKQLAARLLVLSLLNKSGRLRKQRFERILDRLLRGCQYRWQEKTDP